MTFRSSLGAIAIIALLASCDKPAVPPPAAAPNQTQSGTPAGPRGVKVRYALFLNRMRSADPQQPTFEKAMIDDQNEIGLVFDQKFDVAKVPDLMRTIVGQMAAEFPGEDLTVNAYTSATPPKKIGTAKLNGQTKEVTYAPAAN